MTRIPRFFLASAIALTIGIAYANGERSSASTFPVMQMTPIPTPTISATPTLIPPLTPKP